MKITYLLAILLHLKPSKAEPCYSPVNIKTEGEMNVLICQQLTDTDFPLDSFYYGTYNEVYIQGNKGNLTKIPAMGLSGISTSFLQVVGNEGLVTIESGFMEGSEGQVEEIFIRGYEAMR